MNSYLITTIVLMVIGCISNVIMLWGLFKGASRRLAKVEVTCIAANYQILSALLVVITMQRIEHGPVFESKTDSDVLDSLFSLCCLVASFIHILVNSEQILSILAVGFKHLVATIAVSLLLIFLAIATYLIGITILLDETLSSHLNRLILPFFFIEIPFSIYMGCIMVEPVTIVINYCETKYMEPRPANPNGLTLASIIDFSFRFVILYVGLCQFFVTRLPANFHFILNTLWTISSIIFAWILILSDWKARRTRVAVFNASRNDGILY